MPTLAMQANKNVDLFMDILETKINEAKEMLIERFEWICSQNQVQQSLCIKITLWLVISQKKELEAH